ncbi:MAG: serine kinase [Pseudoxanthomonas sp.]
MLRPAIRRLKFLIDDDVPGFLAGVRETGADPFCERSSQRFSMYRQLLGGSFHFESSSEALLHLVAAAYDGLPAHQLSVDVPKFHIELRLMPRQTATNLVDPPPVRTQSGAGLLCGIMDASNYVVLAPGQRRGIVVASEDMLARPYHLRYELIEFAVFTLATRGQGLVPLHGACVGLRGRGILLLGASGSGKSTTALHSLLRGLDFLAEDAVFVQPDSLLATGVANYLHVQADALRLVDDDATRHWIGRSPIIRRRSGVEKFEADVRQGTGRIAPDSLQLTGAVFVSAKSADDAGALLHRLEDSEIGARLVADQPYASGQPGWQRFEQRLLQLGVHELRRGRHPRDAVEALRRCLE